MDTPVPTYSFDTGVGAQQISIGGSPADANVAASNTHIVVTARGAFACYTKGGALVSPGVGFLPQPYTAQAFFKQMGITISPAFDGSTTNTAKDARVVFDQTYWKRFFMVFQSREATARLLIAVSKSEDPRDGWWTYADTVGTPVDPLQDYQWLGVNSAYLLVANIQGGATKHRHYYMYPTAKLVIGQPYTRLDPPIKASRAVPCVHCSYTNDAFWLQRDDDTHVSVLAVRDGNVTSKQVTIQESASVVNGTQLGGAPVYFDNIFRDPQSAHYRDGRIVFVSNDGHPWSGQSSPNNAVRLVRLNVSKYFDPSPSVTVEIDRIFGRASSSDAPGMIFDYGWPAVAVNAKGDIVVGSVRSHSTIYPELRANVWFAGQADISPSVSIATSVSALSSFHMAGACADPSGDGVYLAQQHGATSPSWRIRIAKMLGEILPDLIATEVKPPATIFHGASGSVTVTVMNQGDGPIPASTGTLYLSIDQTIDLQGPDIVEDPSLGTFQVPALAPSQVANVVVPFTAPQTPGKYFVGVALYSAASEYSKFNNVNPFLSGNHGNAPITVTGFGPT
jgi:hypothetical protein